MSPSPVAKIAPSTTLMRENDLIPNIMDLENLFDTDEEVDTDSVSKILSFISVALFYRLKMLIM